jgi:hypothetical protein
MFDCPDTHWTSGTWSSGWGALHTRPALVGGMKASGPPSALADALRDDKALQREREEAVAAMRRSRIQD